MIRLLKGVFVTILLLYSEGIVMTEGFNIINFLRSAVASGASDEHLHAGQVPYIRLNGFVKKINLPVISKEEVDKALVEIAPQKLKNSILDKLDVDFMFEIKGCSRFRVNYNRQMNQPGLVIRNIPHNIPDTEALNLPEALLNVIKCNNGIILVTGPTGSGKSTTLASLIKKVSDDSSKHIITIEDPVEYVFNCSRSIITQRQIEIDTESYASGIKYALRQDPDVIFIGEIRDRETMTAALKAAETGHLVFSTLHTNDAVQTINRIINMYEESNRPLIRKQLADTLRATIAQKLVYSENNKKRYPACEVMVVSPAIKDYIIKDNTDEIYQLLSSVNIDDMISMNGSLALLVERGFITQEEALSVSNDKNELEILFRGAYQGTKAYYE